MDNAKLPPIPTPLSQRWREFRIQVLPFVAFLLVLVGIIHLWRNFVQPVGIVGFVETNQVRILPLQDGLVSSLFVDRFQTVTQGQDIAVVNNYDPKLIQAQVASVQADLLVLRDRLTVDKVRTDQNYQQFQETLFKARMEQEVARARLPLAENDFRRAKEQFLKNILPEASYDLASNTLATLQAEVAGRNRYIADLEASLNALKPKVFPNAQGKDSIEIALEAKEEELMQQLRPSTIKSPIDGVVSMVHVQQGEQVRRGVPIATITPHASTNVIGYVRQPIQRHPQVGDRVQVTTRTSPRLTGEARVLKIGAQLEPLNPALLSAETPRMEMGLPLVIGLPGNIKLLPGEFVDIALMPGAN
jgi:multidrug resistance efflux pump